MRLIISNLPFFVTALAGDGNSSSFLSYIRQFRQLYFMFLDSDSAAYRSLAGWDRASLPARHAALQHVESLMRDKLFVLVYEQYSASVGMAGEIFGVAMMQGQRAQGIQGGGEGMGVRRVAVINGATATQNRLRLSLSLQELKQVNALLEAPLAVYHLALQEFSRQGHGH
jgi:hypothetical protein